MIGVGNDNSGPYTHARADRSALRVPRRLRRQGGWPTWNTNGDYPLFFAQTDDDAQRHVDVHVLPARARARESQRRGAERHDAHAPVPRRRAAAVPADRRERQARRRAVRARLLRLSDAARGDGHAARHATGEDAPRRRARVREPARDRGGPHALRGRDRRARSRRWRGSAFTRRCGARTTTRSIRTRTSRRRARAVGDFLHSVGGDGHRLRDGRDARSRRRVLGDQRRRRDVLGDGRLARRGVLGRGERRRCRTSRSTCAG